MDKPKPSPRRTEETAAEAARRDARLAAALRENLKRRKTQAREREDHKKE